MVRRLELASWLNDDGYLYFKTDDVEVGFLPKEDEIWIFPPVLQHNVKTNKKSLKNPKNNKNHQKLQKPQKLIKSNKTLIIILFSMFFVITWLKNYAIIFILKQ